MIDFHCHLDLYPVPDRVVDRVIRENMFVLAVTTTPRAWQGTCKLLERATSVRVALGLHPELVAERHDEVELLCTLLSETPYVGEVGLDASPQCRPSFTKQREVLGRILAACANDGGRILSVHSRGAAAAVLDALEAHLDAGTPVLHWFSGTPSELRRAIELGCWFSVGPAMLATEKGCRLAQAMPREGVLTETDGPFANRRGEPLMPWDVGDAETRLAGIWGVSPTEAANQVAANCRRLLGRQVLASAGARVPVSPHVAIDSAIRRR